MIIELILATDLMRHYELVSAFNKKVSKQLAFDANTHFSCLFTLDDDRGKARHDESILSSGRQKLKGWIFAPSLCVCLCARLLCLPFTCFIHSTTTSTSTSKVVFWWPREAHTHICCCHKSKQTNSNALSLLSLDNSTCTHTPTTGYVSCVIPLPERVRVYLVEFVGKRMTTTTTHFYSWTASAGTTSIGFAKATDCLWWK